MAGEVLYLNLEDQEAGILSGESASRIFADKDVDEFSPALDFETVLRNVRKVRDNGEYLEPLSLVIESLVNEIDRLRLEVKEIKSGVRAESLS